MGGRTLLAAVGVAAALAVVAVVRLRAGDVAPPPEHRAPISERYPDVAWVSADDLARRLGSATSRPVVIDVRTAEEYRVSRIPGAVRLDPDERDLSALPPPDGREIVVYCSLGYRSAAAVADLQAAGYRKVSNLDGGIFGWANERRTLENAGGAAIRVHPYDERWGQALDPDVRAPLE